MVRHQHVVIDPTPLREAINALPGQEFKLGERLCCKRCVHVQSSFCSQIVSLVWEICCCLQTLSILAPTCAGEMSDAGELLLVLFEHMKGVAPAVAGAAVDAVFGLRVAEAVECQSCGRETQQCRYTQVAVMAGSNG
jgi:uncharacterized UBP type Zn finger protein